MAEPREPEQAEQEQVAPQPPEEQEAASQQPDSSGVAAKVPDFAEMTPPAESPNTASLDCLMDVRVTVTAELGRAVLPIGELLKLGVGSVLELNRPVSEPVDLLAQGVRLARGEVVVVDDQFAIRIKEITDPKKR